MCKHLFHFLCQISNKGQLLSLTRAIKYPAIATMSGNNQLLQLGQLLLNPNTSSFKPCGMTDCACCFLLT